MIKQYLITITGVVLGLALGSCNPQAKPFAIEAASCELAAVQEAVNQAQDGDTVNIPAGTATWTSGINISKGITLHGQTTTRGGGSADAATDDKTVIVDETVKAVAIIQFNTEKPYHVTGITFRGGTTPPNGSGHACLVLGNGTGKLNPAVHADNIHFDNPQQRCVWQDGWMYGVIDNVVMHTSKNTQSFYMTMPTWNGEGYGNGSWADFPYFGSEKFMFIEDCSIIAANGAGGSLDNMNGGRWIVRHCYWKDAGLSGHGTESGPQRGNRCDEWYDNIFDFTRGDSNMGQRRSGNEIVHDNTWIDRAPSNNNGTSLGGLMVYRMGYRAQLWDYAQGTNGWDTNDPQLYDSGTVIAVASPPPNTAKDQQLVTVPGKTWTKDQWKDFSITNISSSKPYQGIVINSNTEDTLYVKTNFASDVPQDQWVKFNAGDQYEIHKVVHALDSAGIGKGDLIRMVNGVPVNQVDGKEKSNPHQMREVTYTWNNVVAKTGYVLGQHGQYCVVEGRDFFNLGGGLPKDVIPAEVKAFYTAANNGVAYTQEYPYPHPLRSGSGAPSPSPTSSGVPTPSATVASPAPTATPSPTPTETPALTQTPQPTATATVIPTATPVPTLSPTAPPNSNIPNPPSDAGAVAGVTITWADNAENEIGYQVQRSEQVKGQCNGYSLVADLPPNTTHWVDAAVEKNLTYCYRVRAKGKNGNYSAWSNMVTISRD